jgi:hypothetical protein
MLKDLVDAAAENEEPWDSRDDRGEPIGLGWLEFDLVLSMVAVLLLP